MRARLSPKYKSSFFDDLKDRCRVAFANEVGGFRGGGGVLTRTIADTLYGQLGAANVWLAPQRFKDLPWIDVTAYGVTADGVTDDTIFWQDAIDALGSAGGTLYLPWTSTGSRINGSLNFTAADAIRLIGGAGGPHEDAAKILVGATSGTVFDFRGCAGVLIETLYIPTLGDLNGQLIDFRATGSARISLSQVFLRGSQTANTDTLVYFGGCHSIRFDNCNFQWGRYQIARDNLGAGVSGELNACAVTACTFDRPLSWSFNGFGAGVAISGSAFEPKEGGGIAALRSVSGATVVDAGAIVTGNWFGDAVDADTGSWVQWRGRGLIFTGNKVGVGGGVGVETIGAVQGVVIEGNDFDGGSVASGTAISIGAGSVSIHIGPNGYNNVTTKVNLAGNPTGAALVNNDSRYDIFGSNHRVRGNTDANDVLNIIGNSATQTGRLLVLQKVLGTEVLTVSANGDLQLSGYLTVHAGASTSTYARVGGVLNVNTTAVGNVGAGEDDLISYTVPASSMSVNNDFLEFEASGSFAATANNKRIRVKWGSTTIFDTGALVITAASEWCIRGKIVRTGATAQKTTVTFFCSDATLKEMVDEATAAEILSNNLALKLTGEATANDDVKQESLITKWMPNK